MITRSSLNPALKVIDGTCALAMDQTVGVGAAASVSETCTRVVSVASRRTVQESTDAEPVKVVLKLPKFFPVTAPPEVIVAD